MINEDLVQLVEAARQFRGGGVHVSTLHRYRVHGVKGVRLQCVRLGARWFTSFESIDRFIAQLNGIASCDGSPGPAIAATGHAEAERNLDRLGL